VTHKKLNQRRRHPPIERFKNLNKLLRGCGLAAASTQIRDFAAFDLAGKPIGFAAAQVAIKPRP